MCRLLVHTRIGGSIDPSYDSNDPNNWAEYSVPSGMIHMNGDLALWYARSREASSDFDRGRRQQEVLRAMFAQALKANTLSHIPQLYSDFSSTITTDLGLADILKLVSLRSQVDQRQHPRFLCSSAVCQRLGDARRRGCAFAESTVTPTIAHRGNNTLECIRSTRRNQHSGGKRDAVQWLELAGCKSTQLRGLSDFRCKCRPTKLCQFGVSGYDQIARPKCAQRNPDQPWTFLGKYLIHAESKQYLSISPHPRQ